MKIVIPLWHQKCRFPNSVPCRWCGYVFWKISFSSCEISNATRHFALAPPARAHLILLARQHILQGHLPAPAGPCAATNDAPCRALHCYCPAQPSPALPPAGPGIATSRAMHCHQPGPALPPALPPAGPCIVTSNATSRALHCHRCVKFNV